MFVLLVSVYFLLPRVQFFKLKSIEVTGVQRSFQTETVVQKSGLQVGAPLFSIHLEEVVSHLKEEQWVDHVRVQRRIPNTLKIDVTEYEPKLILNLDRWYLISSTGRIFKELDKKDSKDFPVLTGLSREEIEKSPIEMKEVISQAIELLKKYEKTKFINLFGISEIHYDFKSGFALFPEKKQVRILFGFRDFDEKLKRLALAVEELNKKNRSFSSIDLNYDGKVILTM